MKDYNFHVVIKINIIFRQKLNHPQDMSANMAWNGIPFHDVNAFCFNFGIIIFFVSLIVVIRNFSFTQILTKNSSSIETALDFCSEI